MKSKRIKAGIGIVLMLIFSLAVIAACSSTQRKAAGEGAATGAVAGAVGGLVSGLVFGGDPVERAAQGAAIGASTGATAGAISGAKADAAKKQQLDAQLEKLKKEIGEDAFKGLTALAECKHDVAIGYARSAAGSEDRDQALAGLWLETLSYADRKEEDKAREFFPEIVANDAKIRSEAQAEETMRKALQKLMDIRGQYGLQRVCG
jgi:hypothetical protein